MQFDSAHARGCNLQMIIPSVNFTRCDSAYHAEFEKIMRWRLFVS